jgi:hypothetical protein
MRHRWALITITVALMASALILSEYRQSWHLLAARAFAQHPSAVGPNQVKTEIDNATTTVLRIRLAPHEKTPMHDVSARLVVWLTDAHLRDTAEDGTTIDYYRTAGAVDWISAHRHAGENLSDKPVEFLAILPKPAHSTSDAAHRDRQ